jgi:outer membrane protein assembly factor BamB
MKLYRFDVQTGNEDWRVDVVKAHDGCIPQYGNAESPVVEGDLVIIAGGGPGQSVMAFNKNTGQVAWKAEDAVHLYSTPIVTTIHGVRQVVFYMRNDVLGISVKDGKRLWRSACSYHNHNCMQPIGFEDKVYCGVGTDGAGVYQVIKEDDGFHSKRLWINGTKDTALIATAVLKDGYLFGGLSLWGGSLKCMEFATGKVLWAKGGIGNGSGILVGDKLVFLSEKGALLVVEPKPQYKELARFDKAIAGRCYSTPAFSNGRLYLRSRKEGVCYDLSVK